MEIKIKIRTGDSNKDCTSDISSTFIPHDNQTDCFNFCRKSLVEGLRFGIFFILVFFYHLVPVTNSKTKKIINQIPEFLKVRTDMLQANVTQIYPFSSGKTKIVAIIRHNFFHFNAGPQRGQPMNATVFGVG